MLKPNVGDTVLASSPLMRFTIVVFPALSSPLHVGPSATAPRARLHDAAPVALRAVLANWQQP